MVVYNSFEEIVCVFLHDISKRFNMNYQLNVLSF